MDSFGDFSSENLLINEIGKMNVYNLRNFLLASSEMNHCLQVQEDSKCVCRSAFANKQSDLRGLPHALLHHLALASFPTFPGK